MKNKIITILFLSFGLFIVSISMISGLTSTCEVYDDFSSGSLDTSKWDEIEWIVPSLSNQTYEIILITKAQHLDSNRNFISDIYEQVKAKDNIWSERS